MKKLFLTIVCITMLAGCGSTPATQKAQVEGKIEDIALKLVTDMSIGDFNKAMNDYSYTAKMLQVINATYLKDNIWGTLVKTYGSFKEITSQTTSQAQGYDIVSIKASFEKARLNINVVFDSNKVIAGLNYTIDNSAAVEEKLPDGITETTVTFGKKGWELPGTLTTPKAVEKAPVVIMVHGSGPNDRDETVGPNKPFKDIALDLAEKGIASLRYDKRTNVYAKKITTETPNLTVYDETIDDAVLAVQFLKAQNNIDSSKIYILGHSLGGMLISRIAEKTPDAAGYIAVSAPVTPLEDITVEQIKYISEVDGKVTDDEKKAIESYEKMRDNIKKLDSNSKLTAKDLMGGPVSYWLDLKGYNPATLALKIIKPLLILQGERDYQVPMKEFEIWKSTLANKKNVTFISYPGLNHLLLKGTDKSQPAEYNIPGKVDSIVIENIASWIKG